MSDFSENECLVGNPEEKTILESESVLIEGHSQYVIAVVYFGNPHFKLVSGSGDGTCIIWDAESYRPLEELKHDHDVRDVIIWDESSFLTSSYDGYLRRYSIMSPFHVIQRIGFSCSLYKMMKIDETRLVVTTMNENVLVMTIRGEVFKELCKQRIQNVRMVKSLSQENCFFLNVKAPFRVLLINWETDEVVEEFEEIDGQILSISNYLDEQTRGEVLVCGGINKTVYFYDISSEGLGSLFRKLEHTEDIFSSQVLMNKYILLGGISGTVSCYEIDERSVYYRGSVSVHCSGIWSISTEISEDGGSVRVFTGSMDSRIGVAEVEGLKFPDVAKCPDLKERLEFVIKKGWKYCCGVEDKVLVKVDFSLNSLTKRELFSCPRILFL